MDRRSAQASVGLPGLRHIVAADLHHPDSKGACVLRDADSAQVLSAEVPQAPLRSDQALQEEVGSPKDLSAAV